jgi:hypothetical protein
VDSGRTSAAVNRPYMIGGTKHCRNRTDDFPTPESDGMSSDLQVDSDTLAKMLINSYEMVTLVTDYASRYGYLLGGLEMVAAGQASADKVLESYKAKYETTPEPDATRPTS